MAGNDTNVRDATNYSSGGRRKILPIGRKSGSGNGYLAE